MKNFEQLEEYIARVIRKNNGRIFKVMQIVYFEGAKDATADVHARVQNIIKQIENDYYAVKNSNPEKG